MNVMWADWNHKSLHELHIGNCSIEKAAEFIESFVKTYSRSFSLQLELKGTNSDDESDSDLV